MSEENVKTENLDDFGLGEFSLDQEDLQELKKEEVSMTEDLVGFAKGFPKWDLYPPKK